MEQPAERDASDRGGARAPTVVVDEDEKRDAFLPHEGGCVAAVSGADRHDIGTRRQDLVISLAQLRGVLAAEQSAEVAEEDQDHDPFLPVATEAVRRTVGAAQFDLQFQLHSKCFSNALASL